MPSRALPTPCDREAATDFRATGQRLAQAATRTRSAELAGKVGCLRVLVAEDNPVNQRLMIALLAPLGFAVELVDDGAALVEAWQAQDWDLILTDIQMPVLDGLCAVRQIRAVEAARGLWPTPIVAVTACAMADDDAVYRAAGMDGLVRKPIGFNQLIAAMEDAIGRYDRGSAD